jgi:hypothetical protein
MRRTPNPAARTARQMERLAQQVAQTPADRGRGSLEDSGAAATATDETSGEVLFIGLLGVTRFNEPFRLG